MVTFGYATVTGLWAQVKPLVRETADGMLILNDTVQEKPTVHGRERVDLLLALRLLCWAECEERD